MLTNKKTALRRLFAAGVFATMGAVMIATASAPAQAQGYSTWYGNHYYSNSPYYNSYEAHRAWWRWHQYWRWYHQYYNR